MWNRIALVGIGACAGFGVAAGVFAFLLVICIVPRMIRKFRVSEHIMRYETIICFAAGLGSVFSVFDIWDLRAGIIGHLLLALYGMGAGIFVGGMAVALAEILDTFPVMFRRLGIKEGLSIVIVGMAFGKGVGAFIYFWLGFA